MPSREQTRGRFIVVEGLDGAGTTTQAGLLAGALRGRDLRVCLTAEPTDGPLGRVLRAHVRREIALDPVTAALTFTADRADHLARVVRPSLDSGEWVVCDRYLLSTLAYQGADGVDREWVLDASVSFERPDMTVVLDVPARELATRLGTRTRVDRYEAPEMSQALRDAYERSIDLLRGRGHRIEVINGTAGPEEVLKEVLSRLDALD